MRRSFQQTLFFCVIVVVLLVVSPYHQLLSNEMIVTDDAEHHLGRVANYVLALQNQQIPPRWAPHLFSSYGYPTFLFVYHLPYAVSSVLYSVLGSSRISLTAIYQSTYLLFLIFGASGMWMLVRRRGVPWMGAILSSLTYIFAPYTILNVLGRGAFGEMSFFAIFPWMFYFLEKLLFEKQPRLSTMFFLYGTLILFLLSHQPMIFVVSFLFGPYFFYQAVQKKRVRLLVFLGITAIFSTCWFWIPAFVERQYTEFEVRSQRIGFVEQFPDTVRLFITGWNTRFHEFDTRKNAYLGWIPLFLMFIIPVRLRQKKSILESYLWGCFFFSLFMMMPVSAFLWNVLSFFQYLQFPWRLLYIVLFCSSILVGMIYADWKRARVVLGVGIIIALLISTSINRSIRGYATVTDYDWFEYTGVGSSFEELTPIWMLQYTKRHVQDRVSFRFSDCVPSDAFDCELQSIPYEISVWDGTQMKYQFSLDRETFVIQRTAYFPGWEVFSNNQHIEIINDDHEYPGVIVYRLPAGKHLVFAQFTEHTPARFWGTIASFGGILIFSIGMIIFRLATSSLFSYTRTSKGET